MGAFLWALEKRRRFIAMLYVAPPRRGIEREAARIKEAGTEREGRGEGQMGGGGSVQITSVSSRP